MANISDTYGTISFSEGYPEVATLGEVGACAMNYMMCMVIGGGRFS